MTRKLNDACIIWEPLSASRIPLVGLGAVFTSLLFCSVESRLLWWLKLQSPQTPEILFCSLQCVEITKKDDLSSVLYDSWRWRLNHGNPSEWRKRTLYAQRRYSHSATLVHSSCTLSATIIQLILRTLASFAFLLLETWSVQVFDQHVPNRTVTRNRARFVRNWSCYLLHAIP